MTKKQTYKQLEEESHTWKILFGTVTMLLILGFLLYTTLIVPDQIKIQQQFTKCQSDLQSNESITKIICTERITRINDESSKGACNSTGGLCQGYYQETRSQICREELQ